MGQVEGGNGGVREYQIDKRYIKIGVGQLLSKQQMLRIFSLFVGLHSFFASFFFTEIGWHIGEFRIKAAECSEDF